MAVKFTVAEKGGYIHSDGDIQIVAYDGDLSHGERAFCKEAHTHEKGCALVLLDAPEILVPAHKDEDGLDVAAVLGKSPREKALAWFAAQAARPPAPAKVALPQKTIKVKDDKGKIVDKQVDDGDL